MIRAETATEHSMSRQVNQAAFAPAEEADLVEACEQTVHPLLDRSFAGCMGVARRVSGRRVRNSFRNEFAARPCGATLLAHEERPSAPHVLLGLVRVVGTAPKFQVLDRRFTPDPVRHEVVKFEEARLAAPAVAADKGAPADVPRPHGTLHGRRNMAGR